MRFAPKSDTEIEMERAKATGVWLSGIYDFEITNAEDKISSKGNEMLVLTVAIFDKDGDRKHVTDYLLEAIAHKLKHAALACGLTAKYDLGTLVAMDFIGCTGRLRLGIETDRTGNFPDKNRILDYEKKAFSTTAPSVRPGPPLARKPVHAGAGSDLDDEIPF